MSDPVLFASTALTLRNPLAQPASFLGLEASFVALGIVTLLHALSAMRAGDRRPLFTWSAVLVYGVAIEIISYNTVDNFTHGQFVVMFYHAKLPLYVTALYPVFLYTAIQTASRLGLPAFAEAMMAGLFVLLLDVPFDVLGPDAGWWTWTDGDPNTSAKWLGVPLTSYYWHVAFCAVMCGLTRVLGRRARPDASLGWGRFALVPVAAVGTLFAGFVSFVPYHALKAVGVGDRFSVTALVGVAAVATGVGLARSSRRPPLDARLLAIALVHLGFHAAVAFAVLGGTGNVAADRGAKALVVLIAIAAGVTLAAVAHLRREAVPAVRAPAVLAASTGRAGRGGRAGRAASGGGPASPSIPWKKSATTPGSRTSRGGSPRAAHVISAAKTFSRKTSASIPPGRGERSSPFACAASIRLPMSTRRGS